MGRRIGGIGHVRRITAETPDRSGPDSRRAGRGGDVERTNLSVTAAFDLSYADLTGAEQRMFRYLGVWGLVPRDH